MSYFSQKLGALLAKHELSQSDLATTAGIAQSQISRLLSDERQSVSPEDLAKIATNLTHEQRERAELLAAYLQDRCSGPGSELVRITVEGDNHVALYDRPPSGPPLTEEMERIFALLRANAGNKNVRIALKGLAELLDDATNGRAQLNEKGVNYGRGAGVSTVAAAARDARKQARRASRPQTHPTPRRSNR